MPGYSGPALAKLLYENKQVHLFNAETVAAGVASRAFELRRERGAFYPWGWSIEAAFGAAPGTFELDVQVADVDDPGHYVTIGTITAVNASNVGRFDAPSYVWAKFVRVLVVTLATPGVATVLLTR